MEMADISRLSPLSFTCAGFFASESDHPPSKVRYTPAMETSAPLACSGAAAANAGAEEAGERTEYALHLGGPRLEVGAGAEQRAVGAGARHLGPLEGGERGGVGAAGGQRGQAEQGEERGLEVDGAEGLADDGAGRAMLLCYRERRWYVEGIYE